MSLVDDFKAEYESYKADVVAKIGGLQGKVADLEAKLAAPVIDPAAVQALLDEIKADHAALNPPAPPAANTDPAPSPTTTDA